MTKSALWDFSNNYFQRRFECRFTAAFFPAILVLFLFAFLSGAMFGQTATTTPVNTSSGTVAPGSAPTSAQQPKFDVADIHTSPTAPGFVQTFGGVLSDGRYFYRDATILDLIKSAYGASEDQIAGGPAWVGYDLFDVIAKVPAGTSSANANLMLRSLLADRFSLVIHNGTGPVPRYMLTVGKGGSKLKPSSGSGNPGCQPQQQAPAPNPGGGPVDPAAMPNIKVACHNLTAADIADNLHQMAGGYLDHDVIDQTKLEGTWDFNIEWTARGLLAAKGDAGISIFDAAEKQLGLKLEVQNVELPSLVIESVNRKPTPNSGDVAADLGLSPARFEVASIKPENPADPPFNGVLYTGGMQVKAGGTLRQLIAMALQIPPNVAADTVIGIPKSADSQRWNINAELPSTGEAAPHVVNGRPTPPPFSVALEMLRGMLADRFELKTHAENREVTVYALTVEHNKPKMIAAADSERTGCKPDPNAPKPFTNIQMMIACKNTSMAELVQDFPQWANAYVDHPIVDATGLQGGWDFLVGWTPRGMLQTQQAPNPNGSAGAMPEAPTPTGVSFFDAIASELGLKLVKQQRSIPVIVVDHVDDKPIE